MTVGIRSISIFGAQAVGTPPVRLSLSASTIEEGLAQGTAVLTFTPQNASNPGSVSLSNITPASAVQMDLDGVTLEAGSYTLSFATDLAVTFTATFSDDNGTYNVPVNLTVVQNGVPAGGPITLTFDVDADETAPTLSSPVGTKTGTTTADGGVTTNEGNGTIYMVTTTSATTPSGAQIIAGTDESNSAAAFDDSLAVSSTGAKTFALTGLTANTTYYNHYTQEDAAGNISTPVSSASFTTDAAGGITVVGIAMDGSDNGANVVVDLSSISMADGDRIYAFGGGSSGVHTAITCSTTGFALVDPPGDLAVSDTYRTNFSIFEHVVSGTPPASVTMVPTYNSTGAGAGGAIVLRGVDAATPLDQAIALIGASNTAYANAQALTPGSANALLVVVGFCSTGPTTPTPYSGPANMTGFQQASGVGSARGGTAFIALKTDPTNGVSFDPDPLTAGTDSTSACWAAATIIFKAA